MSKNIPSCEECVSHQCLLVQSTSTRTRKYIDEHKAFISCKKGQQLLYEGIPVTGIYFIHQGKIKVFKTGFNEREQIIRLLKEGDVLGHRGYGGQNVYPIGAVALENTDVCFLETKVFFDVLRQNLDLAIRMMLFYAEELRKTEIRMHNLLQMAVRDKVVDALMLAIETFGLDPRNNVINTPLSRKEIASLAGTTKEQVSRFMADFKKEGLISTRRKEIQVRNLDKLKGILSPYEM